MIAGRLRRKSLHDVLYAAENNNGGSNTRKTRSGFRSKWGIPGTKLTSRPPITRMIGYGTLIIFARVPKPMRKSNRRRKVVSN